MDDASRPIARQLPVILRAGEDGHIVVECPTLPGCISQGRTRDEALANLHCILCRRSDLNQRPWDYDSPALTN